MANYCAKCVYDELKEEINQKYRGWSWLTHSISNWWYYQKRLSTLYLYDFVLMIRRLTFLEKSIPETKIRLYLIYII